MAKHKFLYLLVSLFTFSCVPPSGIIVIQPEYETESLRNVSLLVSVQRSEVIADNPKEINAHIGIGDPDSVLYAFCEYNLTKCILAHSFSQTVMLAEFKHDTSFEVSDFMIDTTLSFSLDLPKDGYCLYMSMIDNTFSFLPGLTKDRSFPLIKSVQFLIFIENLRTFSYTSCAKSEHNGGECCFAIWDNRIGRIVSYGHAFVDLDEQFKTQLDWVNVINQIAEQILWFSPFNKGI
jgi:hypothetical protein